MDLVVRLIQSVKSWGKQSEDERNIPERVINMHIIYPCQMRTALKFSGEAPIKIGSNWEGCRGTRNVVHTTMLVLTFLHNSITSR